MSDYESDYEYEIESNSDDEDHNTISNSDDISYTIHQINSIISKKLDININQYAWTILCLKIQKFYEHICIYDIKNNCEITFIVDKKGYTLYVDNSNNPDSQYPYKAPNIKYTGSQQIEINNYVLIMFNTFLVKSKWNICNCLITFIINCNKLLLDSESYIFSDIENSLISIISTANIIFEFENVNKLPLFGEIIKTQKETNYLTNNRIFKNNNINVLTDLLLIIVNNIDHMNKYENLLTIIMNNLINKAEHISQLEFIMNKQYYDQIILIITKLNLNIDLTIFESKLKDLDQYDSDKVISIDSFETHSFSKNSSSVKITSKLIKRLTAEINNIKSTLKDYPIYVIGTEQNIQLYKVLIVPDYDTPYAGGYYEFDLYIPIDFPNSVPQMKFLTTGGGTVRFNPNLYNCGKVCLSLLNTWATPQWDAANSTIYQILLSIYTMIFVEHPYTNEPAYYNALSNPTGIKASENYNDNIRLQNVLIAIKQQLVNNNTPFLDIIQRHWNENNQKTLEVIDKWGLLDKL